MTALADLQNKLRKKGSRTKAKAAARFFKTGEGHYGAGDVFLGVTVPEQRLLAREFRNLPLKDVFQLLRSREHEFRLTALLILVDQFERGKPAARAAIFKTYLAHTRWINNWDLVDSSSPAIVGVYLLDKDPSILARLARSKSLWERRIAIVATYAFTRETRPKPALQISQQLLSDGHDLIHKAVGWMLREVGKRCSIETLQRFLDQHAPRMPRTALRYAIERFPPKLRARYLSK